MGWEDQEWWREERRKQGHGASWENFKPKPDSEGAIPAADNVIRIRRPRRLRAASTQPQQVFDAPGGSGISRLLYIVSAIICSLLIALGYLIF
ncbi:hypothetical protein SAMN05216588_13411 [Pseudomonas flavescens]|uniref:Uncharacterized protein n=1 Tax=Phytopseudomonas flavescens TaxID=29435 RepID=A0A1G8QB87_9GAMM|nr:hypothetical protein [Pseudomonas flavescens]SDJ01735.1 hypothetical protein SAMN05216588_13411 [Pseudomonas flavescens]